MNADKKRPCLSSAFIGVYRRPFILWLLPKIDQLPTLTGSHRPEGKQRQYGFRRKGLLQDRRGRLSLQYKPTGVTCYFMLTRRTLIQGALAAPRKKQPNFL